MSEPYILSIDQGTTSSRAIVFDTATRILAVAQQEYPQLYPRNGWVEHDPEAIWTTTLATAREALRRAEADGKGKVVAIGITNQRETTLLWDKRTGEPVHNAIVWQDRRTADLCARWRAGGHERWLKDKTGLIFDPYFSASKLHWLLTEVEGAKARAQAGQLAFGTVDSFLIHRLTGRHLTDATNASRTLLFNIHTQSWDAELLELFGVPEAVLPEVLDCTADFGVTHREWFGRPIAVLGVAGDQHAAMIGQGCFAKGDIKSTYGTGCFALINTGERAHSSDNHLLTTLAYRMNAKPCYALEGSIFSAGSALQWLRDGLGLLGDAAQSEALAASLDDNDGVYLVPAFTGLGAPYWLPEARAAIVGLTRASGASHLVRAALEAVAYQTFDLLQAMQADGCAPARVKIDGGMVANDWFNQFLTDILQLPVDKPKVLETTALGVAFLAGLQAGIYPDTGTIGRFWQLERSFQPSAPDARREARLAGWRNAVRSVAVSAKAAAEQSDTARGGADSQG